MSDMAELFSVLVYSNKSGDKSISGGELYGAIMANDCGHSTFFKAEGGSSDDYLLPDGTLSLTGPHHRCIDGDDFFLRLKLYLKKSNEVLELCNGFVNINPVEYESSQNKHITGAVHGRDGYALVNLVSFPNAVQATVEVSLAQDVGPAFYGSIRARNGSQVYESSYEEEYFQTTMFSASQHNPRYHEGSIIPLSRSVVAVPLREYLFIEVQLFHSLTNARVAFDKLAFVARPDGEETKEFGCFQAKVTWAKHRHC